MMDDRQERWVKLSPLCGEICDLAVNIASENFRGDDEGAKDFIREAAIQLEGLADEWGAEDLGIPTIQDIAGIGGWG